MRVSRGTKSNIWCGVVSREFRVEVVEQGSRHVDDEHGFGRRQYGWVGMRSTRSVSHRAQCVEDGGASAKDLCDISGARAEVLKGRMVFTHCLEEDR